MSDIAHAITQHVSPAADIRHVPLPEARAQARHLRRCAGPRPDRAQPAGARARLVADDARDHRQRPPPVRGVPARPARMIDLSVVLPAQREAALLTPLLPRVHQALAAAGCRVELLVVMTADDAQLPGLDGLPARVVRQRAPGYGEALQAGFREAAGPWVLTLDADIVDAATIVVDLWAHRHEADVVIGSRYTDGGEARMPFVRARLSRALNAVFGRGLSLGVRDMSSGLRLYRAEAIRSLHDLPPQPRRPPGHPGPDLCGRLDRRRDAGSLRTRPRRPVARQGLALRRRLRCAPSGGCGSSATRSSAPTTTPAPTTAPSRCSATGSARGTATSPTSSPARARCSTSGAGRAGSSARCRRAASPSTCCFASCATTGASAARWCRARDSPCRSPTPASRACSVRR